LSAWMYMNAIFARMDSFFGRLKRSAQTVNSVEHE
jgi:hypothetical protein